MQTPSRTLYLFREVLSLIGMDVALFWSAGRIDWWPAWAALAVMAVWIAATAVIVLHYNPDLLAERLSRRKGEKPWDAAIVALMGMSTLVRYIVAGLDQRYGWTGGVPWRRSLLRWPSVPSAMMSCSSGRQPPTLSSRGSCGSSPSGAMRS